MLMKLKILFPILIVISLGIFPIKASIYEASHCLQTSSTCSNGENSITAYQHILAVEPWRIELWEKLAQTEMEEENWDAAITAFQKANDLDSLSPQGNSQVGFALLNAGQEERAIDHWLSIIEAGQASSSLYEKVFPILLKNLQIDIAEEVITSWAVFEPDNAQVQLQYGLLKLLRSHDEALDILKTAGTLDQDLNTTVQMIQRAVSQAHLQDDPAYQQLIIGRELSKLGYLLHAELLFVQAVQLNPSYAEAWAFLGEIQQQNGRDGLPALEKAFALDPDNFLTRSLLALYWQRRQEPEKALEIFKQFVEEYPDQIIWQVELSKTTAQNGDIPEGLRILLKALKNAPDNDAFIHIELANYCAAYNIELNTVGLPSARTALLIEGDTLRSLNAMGNILFALSDLNSAERYYLRALEQEPGDLNSLFQLGMIAYLRENADNARYYFQTVLSLSPPYSEIHDAAQRMMDSFSQDFTP